MEDETVTGSVASVTLTLEATAETLEQWPVPFHARLTVVCDDHRLDVSLTVETRAAAAMTAALHTYLRADARIGASLHGLHGRPYEDARDGGNHHVDRDSHLRTGLALDRIYTDTPAVQLVDGDRTVDIRAHGFPHTVIWNPGPTGTRHIPDLPSDAWQQFICVEAAATTPLRLAPDVPWSGGQSLLLANATACR